MIDAHALHTHHSQPTVGHAPANALPALKDPVCGMSVTTASPHRLEHEGKPYYFCSSRCQTKFATEPKAYLQKQPASLSKLSATAMPQSKSATATATASAITSDIAAAIYTCPMHPEIGQDHPGDCPECGMALEPVVPTLDEGEHPELISLTRRFWWTLPLTVAVTVLAMLGQRLSWFEMAAQSWIELALSLPVVLWAGWPFFVRGAQSIVNRSPNMLTLISLGTGAAFVYSVIATVIPGIFPASFVAMGRVAVYFEAAVVIISLSLFGQLLELRARAQLRQQSNPCWAYRLRLPGVLTLTARRMTYR